MPIGTSISPVLPTRPASANTFVPLLFAVPMEANQPAPLRTIGAMLANVSTLLIRVGQPQRPSCAGYGGGGPGRAALALDRRDERGLLAANERAGAEADVDVEAETRAADRGAEQAGAF